MPLGMPPPLVSHTLHYCVQLRHCIYEHQHRPRMHWCQVQIDSCGDLLHRSNTHAWLSKPGCPCTWHLATHTQLHPCWACVLHQPTKEIYASSRDPMQPAGLHQLTKHTCMLLPALTPNVAISGPKLTCMYDDTVSLPR